MQEKQYTVRLDVLKDLAMSSPPQMATLCQSLFLACKQGEITTITQREGEALAVHLVETGVIRTTQDPRRIFRYYCVLMQQGGALKLVEPTELWFVKYRAWNLLRAMQQAAFTYRRRLMLWRSMLVLRIEIMLQAWKVIK